MRIAWEARGSGEPLLLIQGLGYARWGWEPVVEPLARRFRVLVFDNRGIGESDAPPGPYSAAAMAGDALQVLDEAGADSAHVVGASLGGMIAQELALAAPERVRRLVLACTAAGGSSEAPMPAETVELLARAPSLPPERSLRLLVENALAGTGTDGAARAALVERITALRLARPQAPEAWQAQAAAAVAFDASARLGGIAAPTLVVTGDADRVVDPRNSELLAAAIPGARLVRLAGLGHLFFWEEPDRFVGLLEEFLCST